LEDWSSLRKHIVDALLALPMSDDFSMRSQILAGVERNLRILVSRHSAPKIDFSNMVDTAHSWGKGALTQLIESAIELAPGSEGARQLDELLILLGTNNLAPLAGQAIGGKASNTTSHTALILTALPIEYEAVRAPLESIMEVVHPRNTVYEKGLFTGDSATWDVIILQVSMGNINTAVEAERAIEYFRPQVVFFVGVAGGIKDVAIGDVVVATRIYGYESGKAGDKFQPRPDVSNSSYALIQRARAVSRRPHWLARITNRSKETSTPRVFIGPIAAGDKVVTSSNATVYQLIKATYEDTLAIEMEGRGLIAAVDANEQVAGLVVRGISDLVDDKTQSDRQGTQRIAADHASAFAYAVLAELQIGDNISRQGRATTSDNKSYTLANEVLPRASVQGKQGGALLEREPDIDASYSMPQIFVGYSHKDSKWLDELEEFLSPLVKQGQFSLWSDTIITAGHKWEGKIEAALQRAKVAVLLVSPHFLASDFIMRVELPAILRAAEQGRITLFWIAVSSSLYKTTPLKSYQAANPPDKPLDSLKPATRNQVWVEICEKLASAVGA
jgi:nucleoside phosphorylase